jgi:hypothetical protein
MGPFFRSTDQYVWQYTVTHAFILIVVRAPFLKLYRYCCWITNSTFQSPNKCQPSWRSHSSSRGGGGQLAHFSCYNFHIFTVLVQLNVTARMDSNTIGLQSDLYRLDAIHKEKEGKAFPLTSAWVSTCPSDRVSWHLVQISGKWRRQLCKV